MLEAAEGDQLNAQELSRVLQDSLNSSPPALAAMQGDMHNTRCQMPQGDDNERTIPPHIFLIAEADAPSSLFSSFLDKEQAWKETQKERVELRADCENNTYIRLNVF